MKKLNFLMVCTILVLCLSCNNTNSKNIFVTNSDELQQAIGSAQAGDNIVMANGDWMDISIRFKGYGTESKPILLKAETPGEVIISGKSDLRLGGEYLVVDGLYFLNGASPSDAVITFALDKDTVANHSKVINSAIVDYNKSQRNKTDLWVQFKGRYNELDRCYLSGKSNRGPTIRVDLAGNQSIKNHHKITNNHFGPRPPKGGPSAETIQIGNSYTSMAPSYTLVADNLFDHCNGEVEVISSKSNFNEFRNNVFYKSEGSLVTRHGNYCTIDSNYFIGDENSEQIGGIRLIGTGHWVTNNYFYNLKGKVFRSPLAVMNGIPKSPLNRYIQVTDVVVAYNSWVNCTSPLQFGVGSNVDQKDVLPASEIRSERPIRTIVANNLVYNDKADGRPIVAHDSLDGITFKSNLINNQGVTFLHDDAFTQEEFRLRRVNKNMLAPYDALPNVPLFNGFEFDEIATDMFGNSRSDKNVVGAITTVAKNITDVFDNASYGPDWYKNTGIADSEAKTHLVASAPELVNAVVKATNGDTIVLTAGLYQLKQPLQISKKLSIRSADKNNKATIRYEGTAKTTLFQMNPKGELTLEGIHLKGENTQYAFATLQENMSSLYNIKVVDCGISDFDYVLKAYKYAFAEYVEFQSTRIQNCANGIELAAEDDDRGDYNAENVFIANCRFEGVDRNVIKYYRGGYDESTVGGNLMVTNNTFTNCGAREENGILINSYGIINVAISGNRFKNNSVKMVARLWGAKNNMHANNELVNSGELVVQENLPLKLMY